MDDAALFAIAQAQESKTLFVSPITAWELPSSNSTLIPRAVLALVGTPLQSGFGMRAEKWERILSELGFE